MFFNPNLHPFLTLLWHFYYSEWISIQRNNNFIKNILVFLLNHFIWTNERGETKLPSYWLKKKKCHQENSCFLVNNFIWTNERGETKLYFLPIGWRRKNVIKKILVFLWTILFGPIGGDKQNFTFFLLVEEKKFHQWNYCFVVFKSASCNRNVVVRLKTGAN